MIKIRLSRTGPRKKPFFRIVAIDKKRKNKGIPLEIIGFWSPKNENLNIDKENIDMRVRLASALARSGKVREALQYVSQALELDPNDPNSLQLGKQLLKVMEKKGAVAANE